MPSAQVTPAALSRQAAFVGPTMKPARDLTWMTRSACSVVVVLVGLAVLLVVVAALEVVDGGEAIGETFVIVGPEVDVGATADDVPTDPPSELHAASGAISATAAAASVIPRSFVVMLVPLPTGRRCERLC